MDYLLTICSNDKDTSKTPLPAHQRYLSPRIAQLKKQSVATETPALILSGKYGIIKIDDDISHYDHLLESDEVADLVPLVAKQLQEKSATKIIAHMKPRETHGWESYYQLLEQATQKAKIQLNLITLE